MKKYKLSDLDLNEKGETKCSNCPLYDTKLIRCSTGSSGKNSDLYLYVNCNSHIIKLKLRKKINLSKVFILLGILFAAVILYLCIEVFVNISIDVFTPIKYNIAVCCLVGTFLSMVLYFFVKKD